MPLTRLANTVVDQLPAKRDDAITEVMGYGAADLLCYRQASPADLAERQARLWQPWLDWAAETLTAPLVTTVTLEPTPQPEASLAALAAAAAALDDWQLVGLHAATRLTSSLILGFAMAQRCAHGRYRLRGGAPGGALRDRALGPRGRAGEAPRSAQGRACRRPRSISRPQSSEPGQHIDRAHADVGHDIAAFHDEEGRQAERGDGLT